MLEELARHWGYVAITVGTYIEGEAVLLSAGALAHAGVLSLPLVVLSAMLGSLAWGQTWFQVGRVSGRALLERRPQWQARAVAVERWLSRSGLWVLIFGRFLVGMGTLLPAMIGASGYARARFCVFDTLGALVWAAVVACAGFGVGAGLQRIAGHPVSWIQLASAGVTVALVAWLGTQVYAWASARQKARRQA